MKLALLLLLLGLAPRPSQEAPAPFDRTALTIGAESVSWARYACWLVERQGDSMAPAFANHWRLALRAREAGLAVTAEAVRERVEAEIAARLAGAFGGEREPWLAELAAQGTSETAWRVRRGAEVTDELLLEAWVRAHRAVDDLELSRLYEARYGPAGRRVRVRALRLRNRALSKEGSEPSVERLRREQAQAAELVQRLEALRARLAAGEEWQELAAREGEDAEAAAGRGEWAEPLMLEAWPAEVGRSLAALPVGGLSQPLYGRGWYQIFQVLEERITPYEEVEAELRRQWLERPVEALEARGELERLEQELPLRLAPGLTSGSCDLSETVLSIGAVAIARAELARWLAPRLAEILAPVFVERELVLAEASKAGLSLAPERLRDYVERQVRALVGRDHDGSLEAWQRALAERGLTEERVRRSLAARGSVDLLAEDLIHARRQISQAELLSLYRERYGEDGRALELEGIARALPLQTRTDVTPAERERLRAQAVARAREELLRLRDRATSGEDFAALARAESQDEPTAAADGRLPTPFPSSRFRPGLRAELSGLVPGAISEPLDGGDAIWIFRLRSAEQIPFERAEPALRAELQARPPSGHELAIFLQGLLDAQPFLLDLAPLAD